MGVAPFSARNADTGSTERPHFLRNSPPQSQEEKMKYFTPELIALGQSTDDKVLNEQEQLWDEAGDRYVAYLNTVRPQFPSGLKWIDEHYYLHDALILGMGRRDHFLVMVLRLDTPPQSLLTFTYDLIEE